MTEASAQTEFDLSPAGDGPFSAVILPDNRRFWIGVVVAALVHVMFVVGFAAQPPRTIGDPSGDRDAIGVDFISESDLRSISSVSDKAAGKPVSPSNPTPPAPPPQMQAPAPQQTPPPEPQPETPPARVEAPPPPKPVEQASPLPKAEDALEPAPPPTLEDMVDALRQRAEASRPISEAKPEPPKPRATQQKQTRTTMLDLSLPPSVSSGPSGSGGMGMDRPAGITRSGENDSFARGVISALRQNMPQLNNTRGQVTVRITLDMNGNLARTEVVRGSSVAGLDQSVVFSTRQASFPFPPKNARSADLVFLVTYIYR